MLSFVVFWFTRCHSCFTSNTFKLPYKNRPFVYLCCHLITMVSALCIVCLTVCYGHSKSSVYAHKLSCSSNSVINGRLMLKLWSEFCFCFYLFAPSLFCHFIVLCLSVSVCPFAAVVANKDRYFIMSLCLYRTRRVTSGDVPPGLSGACAVTLDSDQAMYLIGGHGYTGKVNTVYRLNFYSCRWQCVPQPEPLQNFSPRDKFAAWDHNDKFVNSFLTLRQFLLYSAMHSVDYAVWTSEAMCTSVCPSVHSSRFGSVSKWINIMRKFFNHPVAPSFYFLWTILHYEILMGWPSSADYPGIHRVYPLMPSPAHLLPLTGSARRVVHGELGFNRWKKIWVYPSVPVNSQPWTARCGDRYDPQPVKRSSEWVTLSE